MRYRIKNDNFFSVGKNKIYVFDTETSIFGLHRKSTCTGAVKFIAFAFSFTMKKVPFKLIKVI